MKIQPDDIDLQYAPETYWPVELTEEQLECRKIWHDDIREYHREAGRIHPADMGGGYLPDFDEDEIEIARVSLRSTTGDQISIRAKRDGDLIRYRIADEYEEDNEEGKNQRQIPPFEISPKPLTLEELIAYIDGTEVAIGGCDGGLIQGFWNLYDCDFASAWSNIYPQLAQYYEQLGKVWKPTTSVNEEQ